MNSLWLADLLDSWEHLGEVPQKCHLQCTGHVKLKSSLQVNYKKFISSGQIYSICIESYFCSSLWANTLMSIILCLFNCKVGLIILFQDCLGVFNITSLVLAHRRCSIKWDYIEIAVVFRLDYRFIEKWIKNCHIFSCSIL
jgi:hypothetical protein